MAQCSAVGQPRIIAGLWERPGDIKRENNYLFFALFWVIPRLLSFILRRFGTLCSISMGG
jgi:hypothetical protein